MRAADQGKPGSVFGFRSQQVIPHVPPTRHSRYLLWLESFPHAEHCFQLDSVGLTAGDASAYSFLCLL